MYKGTKYEYALSVPHYILKTLFHFFSVGLKSLVFRRFQDAWRNRERRINARLTARVDRVDARSTRSTNQARASIWL